MKEYVNMIKSTFDFEGRSTFNDFWKAQIFSIVVDLLFCMLALPFAGDERLFLIACLALSSLYSILIFLPSLSLMVRRLRDAGFSPWLIFVGVIPFFGQVILIVLLCSRSKFQVDVWYKDYNENNYESAGSQDVQNAQNVTNVNTQSAGAVQTNKNADIQSDPVKNESLDAQKAQNFDAPDDQPIKFDESQVTISDSTKSRSQKIAELQQRRDSGEITPEEYQAEIMKILSK